MSTEPAAVKMWLDKARGASQAPTDSSVVSVVYGYREVRALVIYSDFTIVPVGELVETFAPLAGRVANYNVYAPEVVELLCNAGLVSEQERDEWQEWFEERRREHRERQALERLDRMAKELGRKII